MNEKQAAFQDQMSDNHCFGCGKDNPLGMQIKSFWDGEESVCRYQPRPEQCAGPTQYVYGGTIASIIDCHCVGTAIASHYRREKRDIGTSPEIWCVTGKLTVSYLAPTPIDQVVELRASITEAGEKKSIITCRLMAGGVATAEAEVIAIRVPESWKND